jgi:hypothetical protein
VNGNQADNSADHSGAAYVFTRSAGFWSQQDYLKASNTGSFDTFGSAVAIAGETLVIGAPIEQSNATGVNGNQADSASSSGAAYVFNVSNTAIIPNQISGFVWLDNNANGLQDPDEPGFAQTITDFGAPVMALYPQGLLTPIATASLDENSHGRFLFSDLQPGNYYACMSREYDVLGLSVTTQDAGDDAIDSDFDDSPCVYDITINDLRSAKIDLGLVGGPLDPSDPVDPVPGDTGNLDQINIITDSLLINHQWWSASHTFNADNSVIFYSAPSRNGGDRGVARMRLIDNGAEFKFQEWSNLDGFHTNESIDLVIAPQGNWSNDTTQIEVGTALVSGTRRWKTIHFANTFATPPAVKLSLQSANGGDAVDVHVRNITTDSMQIALYEQESKINSGHIVETVGYLLIASDPSSFNVGNAPSTRIELPFQTTGLDVNHNWTTIGNNYQVRLEEDQSRDRETLHVNETVHVIKINDNYLTQVVSDNGGDPSVLRSK